MDKYSNLKNLENFEKNRKIDEKIYKQQLDNKILNNRHKTMIKEERYKRCGLAGLALAIGIVGGVTLKSVHDHFSNNDNKIIESEISDEINDFDEIIKDATHRTGDMKNIWIDYSQIGNYIEQQSDKDIAIYALLTTYGENKLPQYNSIVSNTLHYVSDSTGERYKGLEDYFTKKNVENINEYKDLVESKILALHSLKEIDEKYSESNNGYGGK